MRTLRLFHQYLGCAFAPLLAFFIFTGLLQTFDLHEGRKDGSYRPPAWASAAASVHMHQRLPVADRKGPRTNGPMRCVAAAMAAGSLCTVSLGVVMAWRINKNHRKVLLALAAGAVVPVAVVMLQRYWK